MTFGEKLKKLRNENRLTQDELAERLYVTRTAISKWETDKGYPNIESLKAIASFFSITVDDLLSSDEILTIADEFQKRLESFIKKTRQGKIIVGYGGIDKYYKWQIPICRADSNRQLLVNSDGL